jgi:hypothetical protein
VGGAWTAYAQDFPKNLSDGAGWAQPQYYSTIQLADVNGDGRAELIARSPISVLTWGYDPSPQRWALTSAPSTAFPAFTAGQQVAYDYVGQQLLGAAPDADLRSQYSNLALSIDTFITILNTLAPPAGVSSADWDAVKTQLLTELEYVQDVNTWFSLNATLINETFASQTVSVQTVSETIELPGDSTATVFFTVLSLVTNAGWAALGIAAPEVSVICGLLATAFAAAADVTGGSSDISSEVITVQETLNTQFGNALIANGCLQKTIVESWSLLRGLGRPIAEGQLQWDDTLNGQVLAATRAGWEFRLWQILTPAAWVLSGGPCGPVASAAGDEECPPPAYPLKYVYVADPVNNPEGQTWIEVAPGGTFGSSPSATALDTIFQPAPAGFGVPLTDVFLGRNGWNIPADN